jgi:hypothetical protein
MASRQSLKRAYDIEVFGEAVYAMAAHVTRRPDHRRKWEALRQLEAQTRDQLLEVRHGTGKAYPLNPMP